MFSKKEGLLVSKPSYKNSEWGTTPKVETLHPKKNKEEKIEKRKEGTRSFTE